MGKTDETLSQRFDVEIIPDAEVEVIQQDLKAEDDIELARSTLAGLIVTGTGAVADIVRVADDTESPRAYEVVATMIKTVADVAKDLAAMHKEKTPAKTAPTVGKQTNVFVGSTAEVMRMIKEAEGAE